MTTVFSALPPALTWKPDAQISGNKAPTSKFRILALCTHIRSESVAVLVPQTLGYPSQTLGDPLVELIPYESTSRTHWTGVR